MAEERLHTVGRRKSAVARVWIKPGKGTITVNRKPIEQYMTRETDRILIRQPLTITDNLERFDISVTVRGGGISGQAGAIRHAISRALASLNPDLRLPLKKAALLTRDARVRERKKYGMRGARARYQYSKR
ncbi:MAG: 30S ribosomal protein S9 [Deltaproteobacteria bacterium]|jgi:small subunit ribosomal protein S9|nr:30S ribosomal protein S9 [Deltaproteobacteria bacterium]NTV57332.1 30S ribosomal protein S9 [Deltaproteobacteria bacterium]